MIRSISQCCNSFILLAWDITDTLGMDYLDQVFELYDKSVDR
jgi:hypothetical protein